MLNLELSKDAPWVTCSVSIPVMQKLVCFWFPGIVYGTDLKNTGLYRWWSLMNRTTLASDLITVFLWIQIAINKIHLCSLSITYGCPYHNPTRATTLTSNCSPTQHHTPRAVKNNIHLWREYLWTHYRLWAFDHSKSTVAAAVWWLFWDHLGDKDAGCGVLGLVWLHVACSCEAS